MSFNTPENAAEDVLASANEQVCMQRWAESYSIIAAVAVWPQTKRDFFLYDPLRKSRINAYFGSLTPICSDFRHEGGNRVSSPIGWLRTLSLLLQYEHHWNYDI
jgi:hypothetical protein